MLHAITDADGNPNVFNVNHDDDGLFLNANNGDADNHWDANNRFVFVRRNFLYFSPVLTIGAGEFFLITLPCQAPRFLPISAIFSESMANCFVSKDLASQRIIKRILIVSVLRIASCKYGNLF